MLILSGIFILIAVLLPLYLWAYGATCIHDDAWMLRARFWWGVCSGVFSVGIVYAITHMVQQNFFWEILLLGLFFWVLLAGVVIGSTLGSRISWKYIRAMGVLHTGYMILFLLFMIGLAYIFPAYMHMFAVMIPIFVAVFFEETAKHMTILGYLWKEFRFSLRDFAYFSFFVVIGFVFFENILYFFSGQYPLLSIVYRSIFPFAAHLLSALVCSWMWWKALSFPFFSFRYLLWFLWGLISAIIVHAVYNISLLQWWMLVGVIQCIAAYGVFIWMTQHPKYIQWW